MTGSPDRESRHFFRARFYHGAKIRLSLIFAPWESAPVVKQIYSLCLAGNGPTKIARMLMEQEIPTPGTLEYRRTGSTRRYHPGYECKWATNRHQLLDMEKMIEMGMAEYHFELEQKSKILKYLLENYNDGRRKTFFYLAVNLLSLADSKNVVQQIKEQINGEMTVKEKATVAVERFEAAAEEKGIILKMNKKPSKEK